MTTDRNVALANAGMDALLGATLDDLDDLPSFEVPAAGTYIVTVSTIEKEVNDKPCISADYTVVETVELKDANDKAPAAGSKFNTLFTLNEFGIGKLKDFLKPFAQHFGNANIGELVRDQITDVTVSVAITQRKDKTDPDRVYANVKILSIA